jgi:hypothetical protein
VEVTFSNEAETIGVRKVSKSIENLPVLVYNMRGLGGVAHLGERLNGIQEVRGSIPLISTKSNTIF